MKFKKPKKYAAALAAVLVLSGSFSISTEAKFLNESEFDKDKYYDNSNYVDVTIKAKNITSHDGGTVSFETEQTLNEEYQGEFSVNNTRKRDYIFYIDDETEIYNHSTFSWEGFISGEQPWISFYITSVDYDKFEKGELKEIHVAAFYETAESIDFYPSYEERVRNKRLKALGIMEGDPDGSFNPLRELTRAELAKIAVTMSTPADKRPIAAYIGNLPFTDVTSEHWAYPYIALAYDMGIMDGNGDGTFGPDSIVRTSEAIKVFVSLTGYKEYAEAKGGYPSGYIKTAEHIGLIKPSVKLYDTVTRDDTADLAYNALDIPIMKELYPNTNGDANYVICDGSSPEIPLETIAILNFAN